MMKVTFADWWCNYENYWTNKEDTHVLETRQLFESQEGRKVTIVEKNIGLGKYPSLVKMKYVNNGKEEETDNVKKITFDEKLQLFLFEDYMVMGNRFDGSIYYYVDFLGMPVTDTWSNLVDTIYDKDIFWTYEKNLQYGYGTSDPWLYGYNTSGLYEMISKELQERNSFQRKRVVEKLERRKEYENPKC